MAQHFLYFLPLLQGQGRLGGNLATVHEERDAAGRFPAEYRPEIGGMQPQILLYSMMQEIKIVPVVYRVEFSCKLFESIEIVFAAFTLDAIEIGMVSLGVERRFDLFDAHKKVLEFRNDLPVEIRFFALMTDIIYHLLLLQLLF